nr:hypothetical protein [Reinekea sp.]
MTVRGFIWLWQILEFGLLLGALNFYFPFVLSILFTCVSMLFLRFIFIALVAGIVNIKFTDSRHGLGVYFKQTCDEFRAFCVLYFWHQAIPRSWLSKREVELKSDHVILAHGFLCNEGFWFLLKSCLLMRGISFSAVERKSAFGTIDKYTDLLSYEIKRVESLSSNVKITIVAFSMGGLAARNLPLELQRRVNLITVFTPHNGTMLALLSRLIFAKNGSEMSIGSPWLERLNSHPNYFRCQKGYWSAHDTIVLPPKNSIPPFEDCMLASKGHLYAALDIELHELILDDIEAFKLANGPSSRLQEVGIQTQS